MTTAGAAGIASASPHVRSLSMIESVLAVLYLAVMISRLVQPTGQRLAPWNPHKANRFLKMDGRSLLKRLPVERAHDRPDTPRVFH